MSGVLHTPDRHTRQPDHTAQQPCRAFAKQDNEVGLLDTKLDSEELGAKIAVPKMFPGLRQG